MTLKKWATGSGKADKTAMVHAATLMAVNDPHNGKSYIGDDNEADAVLLLYYAIEKFGGGENPCNARPAAVVEAGS